MFNKFTKVWGVLYTLVAIGLVAVVVLTGMFPIKYLAAGIGLIVVLSAIILPALFRNKVGSGKKAVALIVSAILIAIYGIGISYLSATLDFFSSITGNTKQIEEFYVIAKSDNPAEDLSGAVDKPIYTSDDNSSSYEQAMGELQNDMTKAGGSAINYIPVDDVNKLGSDLLAGTEEFIFVSELKYDAIKDSIEGFGNNTKIIHTIQIVTEVDNFAKGVNVTKEPFNVYVTGIDTTGSITKTSRSDVNMILTVDPRENKILMTSLPRDSYVEVPTKGFSKDKLTHTGNYGPEDTIKAVENLMGIDINYYIKVNFTTVEKIVDIIGGIDIESEHSFTTHGMGVTYNFNKGMNHVNGSQALAFARERKSFGDGDFQRNRDQQIILEAVLKKCLSSTSILTRYTSILNAVEDNMTTNFAPKEIQSLIKMQMSGMPSWNFENQAVTGTPGSGACYALGGRTASVVYTDAGSVSTCAGAIKSIMENN